MLHGGRVRPGRVWGRPHLSPLSPAGTGQCPVLRVSVCPVPSPGWTQGPLRPGGGSLGGSRMDTRTRAKLRQSEAVPPHLPGAPQSRISPAWALRGLVGAASTLGTPGQDSTEQPPPSSKPPAPPSSKALLGAGGWSLEGGPCSHRGAGVPLTPLSAGKGCPFGAHPAPAAGRREKGRGAKRGQDPPGTEAGQPSAPQGAAHRGAAGAACPGGGPARSTAPRCK